MNISYDHYKVFYYVAKYGSFTQAAEALFLNQPNLTRTVRLLENELGCTLFIRTNKGVHLTEDGERLFEHISVAFEHIQAGEEEIAANRSLKKGLITIGATEIALRIVLLPILNHRKHFRCSKTVLLTLHLLHRLLILTGIFPKVNYVLSTRLLYVENRFEIFPMIFFLCRR